VTAGAGVVGATVDGATLGDWVTGVMAPVSLPACADDLHAANPRTATAAHATTNTFLTTVDSHAERQGVATVYRGDAKSLVTVD
jgi:hypothetical protein